MEEEVGKKLFIRGHQQITLTEDGLFLAAQAQKILKLVDKTITNLESTDPIGGDLNIGSGETLAFAEVAEAICNVTTEHSSIQVHLFSGAAEAIFKQLDNGLLDFGIVVNPTDKKKYQSLPLAKLSQWGLLVPSNNPLAAQSTISATDILGLNLIVSDQALVSDELSNWLGHNLEEFHITTYNLLYNAALLVAKGNGVAFCLDHIITPQQFGLRFIPLKPTLKVSSSLIWRRDAHMSRAAAVLLTQIKQGISD